MSERSPSLPRWVQCEMGPANTERYQKLRQAYRASERALNVALALKRKGLADPAGDIERMAEKQRAWHESARAELDRFCEQMTRAYR